MNDGIGFEARIGRIEALTDALEGCAEPKARAAARELVAALLEFHGAGLSRLLELIDAAGGPPISTLARDGLVANLLLLHDLHPADLETRVASALEGARARLGAEVGLDLVGFENGALRLRLTGGCGGCPSTSAARRKVVEDALFSVAPDLALVEFLEPATSSPGHALLPVITL